MPLVIANCTGTPEAAPADVAAITVSGVLKAMPCTVDWLLPETVVRLEIGGAVTVTVMEKD